MSAILGKGRVGKGLTGAQYVAKVGGSQIVTSSLSTDYTDYTEVLCHLCNLWIKTPID